MEVWNFIKEKLSSKTPTLLLWVVASEGSSPGRCGFKMAVAADGSFNGTIGGGMMEHKLVEKAKAQLATGNLRVSLVQQHHDKEHVRDQSGMICSGSQRIAFVPLTEGDVTMISKGLEPINNPAVFWTLSPAGLSLSENKEPVKMGLFHEEETAWIYREPLNEQPVIHILGGGHVALALSGLMTFLGFYVKVYDNRPGLNTVEENLFANEKYIVEYDEISARMNSSEKDYVVIATFGYRDDKIVFRQLLDKKFFYAGMIGSEAKIATLFKELQSEGIDPQKWEHWHIPIGLPIFSKTTKEIAVSIAAEIIRKKNKNLPTGRTRLNEGID